MADSTSQLELPLADADPPPLSRWILWLAASLLLVLAVGGTLQLLMPDDPMPLYFMGGALMFGIALPIVLLKVVRHVRVCVEDERLVVRTAVGQRCVALADLREHGLSVIDLTQHHEFDTRGKTWSATAPGLRTGLYRMRNGEQAVFVVTDPRRVCRLRSDADGLTLLLSLKRPEQFRALLEGIPS